MTQPGMGFFGNRHEENGIAAADKNGVILLWITFLNGASG